MSPVWATNWMWGLLLIVLTLVVHAICVVMIGLALVRADVLILARRKGFSSMIMASTLLIGTAGWMLTVLHGTEAALWAGAYLLLGAVDSLGDAMLYSVDSITTRGASGLMVQRNWRMMGALEAANGMLLFGISTAFLFTVLERVWRRLSRSPDGRRR